MLHKNPDSLGWMSYCTWNKSSDNTQAPTFLFGLKEKKREQACSCHVCSRLNYKNQTKGCGCLRFYFLLTCGSDRTGFSSDSCGNWCQQSSNPGKNPPLPRGPCWDAPAFPGCSSGKHLGFQPQEFAPQRPSASKFTHNQGSLNKNAIKIMELISRGR